MEAAGPLKRKSCSPAFIGKADDEKRLTMLRDEMKKPKNIIGMLLIAAAIIAALAWLVYNLSDRVLYAAAGLYLIGMVIITAMPGRDK